MKIVQILALLLVVFMIGCATTVETEEVEEQENIVEEVGEEAPEQSKAKNGEDVKFTQKGFSEDVITIKAGSAVTIIVDEDSSNDYSFVITGSNSKSVERFPGERVEIPFEEAGEYTVMSIPFNKKLTVVVE